MRSFSILAVAAAAGLMAFSANAATKHRVHHVPACNDKVMCRKLDAISAHLSGDISNLSTTVKAGQAADADYQSKQLAYSDQMLTAMKAIEAQGGQSHSAILLTFAERKMADGEKPADTANQMCLDAGFKAGKPVDVQTRSGWSHNGTYLNSVVCTF